jgi:tetratricopeptide (TPR) repeat protein
MAKRSLSLVRKSEDGKKFELKTFIYYVIAISVSTVFLAQLASWGTAYFKVQQEMTEETDALLAKREEERNAPKIGPGKAMQRKDSNEQSAVESSIRSYRSALQLDPDSVNARQRLGAALIATNRSNEAIEVLREGVKRSPYSTQLRSMLARALEKDGQLEAALQEYEAVAKNDVRATEHLISVARVLESLGRNDDALGWYRRAASENKSFESNYEDALRRLSNGAQ